MTAMNNEVSVKVVVCALAAAALTMTGSWSFVNATRVAPAASSTSASLGEVVISAARQVAQNTPAVLVE